MFRIISITALLGVILSTFNAYARQSNYDQLRQYVNLVNISCSVDCNSSNSLPAGCASLVVLSPGDKVFLIKNSCSPQNRVNGPIQSQSPFLFPHLLFFILYGILLMFFVFVIFRYRSKGNNLKNQLTCEHLELAKQKEIDRIKSDFFTSISHEFRTPLTLIMGPIPHWLQKLKNNDLKNDLMMILRNSRRMLGFINQLVELSLLDYGQMKLQLRPMNIVEILKDLVLSFTSLAEQKEINLSFSSSQDSIIVYIDREKFEEIFSNLIYNAFKFTPSNGKIAVSVFIRRTDKENNELKRYAEIIVMDTGKGIEHEHLVKIFDRFYQIENVHDVYYGGSGIGLCFAKELTKLHNGDINVESKVGQGTIFTVLLPLGKEHISIEDKIEEFSPAEFLIHCKRSPVRISQPGIEYEENNVKVDAYKESTKGPHLLIVEDNADVRAFLKRSLNKEYNILEANTGTEGLSAALKTVPDLILSDVMMPGMDGYELCRKIKTNQKTSHIPVILLTAKAAHENKIEGLETGADDYIIKPFDTAELLVRIKNLIAQRKMLRDRFQREMNVQPADITVTSVDKLFLRRAITSVENHLCDPDFEIHILAYEVGMSRMNLHRKLKALTGQTSAHFISSIRLKRAAQLLKQNAGNVSEVAYEVGFNSLSYFANCFRLEFGMLPSEFLKDQKLRQENDLVEW